MYEVRNAQASASPLVSIIIPTYQYARCVESAYRSAADQTYKNIEIIFVDDGSTDDTALILNDIIKQDKRVRVIHKNRNRGIGAARNSGINAARGEWICFADVDDAMDSSFVEKTLKLATSYKVPMVCTQIRTFRGRSSVIVPFNVIVAEDWKYEEEKLKIADLVSRFVIKDNNGVIISSENALVFLAQGNDFDNRMISVTNDVWGKLYRKDLLTDVRFAEDLTVFSEVIFNGTLFKKSFTMLVATSYIGYNKGEHYDSAWNSTKEEVIRREYEWTSNWLEETLSRK